ncbi:amidophosphoribosyltransferase [Candidatus Micrarchaeota archaeon]|nr:amidophosphoribosyltransferase [Candidatus Micrarchaeota archaeon]
MFVVQSLHGVDLLAECGEKCGVIGAAAREKNVAIDLYNGLIALQHRGQESAGISVFSGVSIYNKKAMGLVSHVFSEQELQGFYGTVGIGHVRYSTTGSSVIENAQPFYLRGQKKKLAVALNGNIVNYVELKQELEQKGIIFTTTTDTELIAQMLSLEMHESEEENVFGAAKAVMEKLDGAYCVLALSSEGELIAFRDPKGFKPLCLGKHGGDFVIASETCALNIMDARLLKEIEPGEAVLIKDGVLESRKLFSEQTAHCMFEYVYFSRPDSVVNGVEVFKVREELGRTLARMHGGKGIDVVVPVPDSGRSAAHGFAAESGLRFAEGLIKNRYIWRTFIMPDDSARKASIKLKLNPVRSLIEGKRVALVEDSLVRGNTMGKIVSLLKETGAREVHVMISCPKIIAPCHMGIDFPTYRELAAAKNSVEEIREKIGADSLNYMNIEGLVKAIGLPRESLCVACLTDEYPTKQRPRITE